MSVKRKLVKKKVPNKSSHQVKVCEKKPFYRACKRNGREDISH